MGSGTALFDADGDGDLDAYLVQGAELEPDVSPGAGAAGPARDRLFRNELIETGELRFVDATDESGIQSIGYGMGVAAGDFDGDGHVDLYVTNLGPNQLWRNTGNGRFEDATRTADADDPRWSVPAAFLDYDGDGALDLFIGNYVDFNLGAHTLCTFGSGEPDYCSPKTYRAEPDRLLRNLGGGRFEEATDRAGLTAAFGNGLGALPADLDGDGRLDLYVANDGTPNQMWVNLGAGRFENRALYAGAAVNGRGVPEAGMGVDAGDIDDDGDLDLYVTHITGETSTFYLNDGLGLFIDAGAAFGLDLPSLPMTGFGTGWIDFDNDGDLDLLAVNGAVRRIRRSSARDEGRAPSPPSGRDQAGSSPFEQLLGQPNQLFRQVAPGRFEDASALGGPIFGAGEVSRGAAFGDVDNDGDVDVLVTNNSGPARLFVNMVGQNAPWIGFRVLTSDGRRNALGSVVRLTLGNGRTMTRTVRTAMSYASSSDPRILVGLGGPRNDPFDGNADDTQAEVEDVMVTWVGSEGSEESFGPFAAGAYHELRRGRGVP